jgi:hypothetical protein
MEVSVSNTRFAPATSYIAFLNADNKTLRYKKVSGYAWDYRGKEWFVHSTEDGWTVTEPLTGMAVLCDEYNQSGSKAAFLVYAKKELDKLDMDQVNKRILALQKKYGNAPEDPETWIGGKPDGRCSKDESFAGGSGDLSDVPEPQKEQDAGGPGVRGGASGTSIGAGKIRRSFRARTT